MALQSLEMRELYDLKVFVVSRCPLLCSEDLLMTEL